VLAGSIAAALLWAPAGQAVTIGAPLDQPATVPGPGCSVVFTYNGVPPPSCSLLGNDISGAWTSQVPRGEWVIRLGRVRTGINVGPMVFTIIRASRSQETAGGIICCYVPVESQVFVPQRANAINEIPVNLPVKNTVENVNGERVEVVDYLGISLLDNSSSTPMATPPGTQATTSYIAPAIRAGQERTADGTVMYNNILLVNGEADPAGGGGGGGGGGPAVPVAVDTFDLALDRFRAAAGGGSVAAAGGVAARRRRAPVGTKVTYTLSAAATVKFTVERRKAGRKVGGKCRKPTRKNRKRKKCNLGLKGSFTHQGNQGTNSFRFTGRLRNRKLKPSRYNLVAKAVGSTAKARRDKFTIVR
jgi:hypothetical protein